MVSFVELPEELNVFEPEVLAFLPGRLAYQQLIGIWQAKQILTGMLVFLRALEPKIAQWSWCGL